jgi:Tfp pilus assembly protein PilO
MAGFSKKIPSKSLRYLAVCTFGVIVFAALAVYPLRRSIADLERKIDRLAYQAEMQKSMYPLYAELKKRLDSDVLFELELPEPKTYPRELIDQVSSAFDEIVENSGLSLLTVNPDVRALAGDSSLLPVRLVLVGPFFNFQTFLTRLGSVPFITHIEEIRAKHIPRNREFEINVWFAVGE